VSGNSVEKLLDRIDTSFSNFLIFAGVLDNNAKLLSYRAGKANFSLPIERHETLDVQISLMFSLIRQLEDISGTHKFTITRLARYDIILFGTLDLHVFIITTPTSEVQVAKTLVDLIAMMTNSSEPTLTPGKMQSMSSPYSKELVSEISSKVATAMASTRHQERQSVMQDTNFPLASRPEVIIMLQGYLLAVDSSCTIDNGDAKDHYVIRANGSDSKIAWSTLEKVNTTFRDKVEMRDIGMDANGRVFIEISLK